MNIKIDNEYMQMQQALQSQYSSINVQNTNSDLNRFYLHHRQRERLYR